MLLSLSVCLVYVCKCYINKVALPCLCITFAIYMYYFCKIFYCSLFNKRKAIDIGTFWVNGSLQKALSLGLFSQLKLTVNDPVYGQALWESDGLSHNTHSSHNCMPFGFVCLCMCFLCVYVCACVRLRTHACAYVCWCMHVRAHVCMWTLIAH